MYEEFETSDWISLMAWNPMIECATDYISGERRVDGEETSINSRLLQTSPVFFMDGMSFGWVEKCKRVARKALHLSERPVIEEKACLGSSIHIVSRLQVWWAKVKKIGPFHMCLRWWSFAFLLICGLIFNFMSKTWTWSHRVNGFDMTTSHKFGLELEKPIPQK